MVGAGAERGGEGKKRRRVKKNYSFSFWRACLIK